MFHANDTGMFEKSRIHPLNIVRFSDKRLLVFYKIYKGTNAEKNQTFYIFIIYEFFRHKVFTT
jgi:hypothetical protein